MLDRVENEVLEEEMPYEIRPPTFASFGSDVGYALIIPDADQKQRNLRETETENSFVRQHIAIPNQGPLPHTIYNQALYSKYIDTGPSSVVYQEPLAIWLDLARYLKMNTLFIARL